MSELMPGVFLVDRAGRPGQPGTLKVCLLVAESGTATLVDAGFPGIAEALEATLAEAGIGPSAVRRVIVTHHHPDHTGGLQEVVALTGAEVWAHRDDAPFITGATPRVMPAGVRPPGAPSFGARPQSTTSPVDLELVGGETLDVLGGCLILHTPGHTPGHLSLLLPRLSLLIAGDILRYEDGAMTRAPEAYTADPELSEHSLEQLARLDFERMLPYHGDFLGEGASEKLHRDLGVG